MSQLSALAVALETRGRECSVEEVVTAALARVEDTQRRLNPFARIDADRSLDAARAMQARVDRGDALPLAGVPLAVKDVTDVIGWETGHGVGLRRRAAANAPAVQRLIDAGMVVVAKTTTSELALWPQASSPLHGSTLNPHDQTRTAGGSSGGSGAAVADGAVPVATGTDGGGSIRIPASYCGLVGVKDRPAAVPAADHWFGLTSVGALTRGVADAALVHSVMLGVATLPEREARLLRVGKLAGVGAEPHPGVAEIVDRFADALSDVGHDVVDVNANRVWTVAATSFAIRFTAGARKDAAALRPARLSAPTRHFLRLAPIGSPLAGTARSLGRRAAGTIARELNGVDVILAPTTPATAPAAVDVASTHLPELMRASSAASSWTSPFNALGWAAVTVPGGSADGLPVGVQLASATLDIAALLALAAATGAPR